MIISEGFVADQLLFVFNPQRKIWANTNLKVRHNEQGTLLTRWLRKLTSSSTFIYIGTKHYTRFVTKIFEKSIQYYR